MYSHMYSPHKQKLSLSDFTPSTHVQHTQRTSFYPFHIQRYLYMLLRRHIENEYTLASVLSCHCIRAIQVNYVVLSQTVKFIK